MKFGAFRFRPRWWGVLLAALGCAAGIALGNWQWGRAAERRATLSQIEIAARAPAIEWPRGPIEAPPVRKRVAVVGEFLPGHTVLLEYRLHRGRPGFHVVQPLRVAGTGTYVLVLRGWVAAPVRREQLPEIVTPSGTQRIEGIALDRLPQYLEPPTAAESCRPGNTPCVWQNLKIETFAKWAGLVLAPVMLEQASDLADGLARDWERPEAGYLKNEMYAMQWYSLAALSLALFAVLSFQRAPSTTSVVAARPPGGLARRGRLKLALIGALFAMPVAIGWIAYLTGRVPGTTSNYGTLIAPRLIVADPVAALRGKWILLQFDGGACNPQCEKKLYYMRQIRRAQGKDMNRVERLWIVTDTVEPRTQLLVAIEGTRLAPANADLVAAFPAERARSEHIYLVDPLGNLMLRFPRDPDPAKMLKDLERLLKYSGFG